MPRLFWKIFVWFWLAIVFVDAVLVFSVLTTRSVAEEGRVKEFAHTMMALQARHAAEIFEERGAAAVSRYFHPFNEIGDAHLTLYRSDGSDVLGPPSGDTTRSWIADAARDEEVHFKLDHGRHTMLQSTMGPSGVKYVLSVERRSSPLLALIRGDIRAQALRFFAVALAGGLLCLILANYITTPILRLQELSRRIATGDLSARSRAGLGHRHDEIADLGYDFDAMAEQIETLLRAQTQLFQGISHEMRSPIARLTLAVGLARTKASSESEALLNRIEMEAGRLDQMLSQLLTIARLDGGGVSFPKSHVELSVLLSEIVADASFEATGRKCSILLEHIEPCVVNACHSLLRSAIENVIRNAVRYAPESSTVEVSLRLDKSGRQAFAAIHVLDSGPGVPSEELTNIFKPFFRVNSARERETGGVGLGLAITERTARLYGGSVYARNRVEGGLHVEIRLPALPLLLAELSPMDPALA